MNTTALTRTARKKKLIGLPEDVCRRLAVQAAAMGTSVKRLIENIIIDSKEDSEDDAIYTYLCDTRPEGQELMDDDAQDALIASLRKKIAEDEV